MIQLIDVKKKFDNSDKYITDGISFILEKGKSLCLIGLSGEGKSILLKQISGLIKPSFGNIILDGIDITNLNEDDMQIIHLKCGYVFQFAALLDSLTIYENISLPLIERGKDLNLMHDIVLNSLIQVNLQLDILDKYPSELSGGMRKRVGFARTIVLNPEIILYDEPTSGLDPINTKIIHELMYNINKKYNATSIVISHDIEVFKYVDYVAFLYSGKINYFGLASTIWECENEFIKQFINGRIDGPII